MLLRKFSLVALVALAIGGITALKSSDANAQASDTATANINAIIANPIVLTKTADLNFATITPGLASSTVIIDPAGTVNAASTAIGLSGTPTAAGFTVSGLPLQAYAVVLPVNGATLLVDGAGVGADMAVNDFTHNATLALTSAGTQPDAFGVGATLVVGANQTAGTYSGSFDVTVSYN